MPWTFTQNNAWNNESPDDDIFCTSWETFLQTTYAQQHVPDWHNKLISLQNTDVNNSSAENSIEPLEREEWMILSDIRVAFQQDNSPSTNYNWGSDRSKYNQQIVNDMASWIERNKESDQHQTMILLI